MTVSGDAATGVYDFQATTDYNYRGHEQGEKQAASQIKVYAAPPLVDTYLSDMNWLETENRWGLVERDQSNGESAAN